MSELGPPVQVRSWIALVPARSAIRQCARTSSKWCSPTVCAEVAEVGCVQAGVRQSCSGATRRGRCASRWPALGALADKAFHDGGGAADPARRETVPHRLQWRAWHWLTRHGVRNRMGLSRFQCDSPLYDACGSYLQGVEGPVISQLYLRSRTASGEEDQQVAPRWRTQDAASCRSLRCAWRMGRMRATTRQPLRRWRLVGEVRSPSNVRIWRCCFDCCDLFPKDLGAHSSGPQQHWRLRSAGPSGLRQRSC